ncbi:unnamed protein product [Boreogadus saida]
MTFCHCHSFKNHNIEQHLIFIRPSTFRLISFQESDCQETNSTPCDAVFGVYLKDHYLTPRFGVFGQEEPEAVALMSRLVPGSLTDGQVELLLMNEDSSS